MPADLSFYAEAENQFMLEAQDLLGSIEQGLMNLAEERNTQTVHQLMRAAHTLKGAAASIERETVMKVAHALEDVFKSLYKPELELDAEVKSLLFDGYECLRLLLTAEFTHQTVDEADILNRIAAVIAQLQDKWGDDFSEGATIPTSEELGFDIVASIFETGITDRLNRLGQALQSENPDAIEETLRTQMDVFIGLAESLNLPGFKAIAQATLAALDHHSDQVLEIAEWAIADLSNGHAAVLAGDRTQGGTVSAELQRLTSAEAPGLDNALSSMKSSAASIDDDADLPATAPLLESWEEEIFTSEPSEAFSESDDAIFFDDDFTDFEEKFDDTFDDTEDSDLHSSELTSFDEFEASLEQILDQKVVDPQTRHKAEPSGIDQEFTQLEVTQTSTPKFQAENPETIRSNGAAAQAQSESRTMPVPTIRVQINQLQDLDRLAGELLISQNKQADEGEKLRLKMQSLTDRMDTHLSTIDALQDWVTQHLNPAFIRSNLAQITTSQSSSSGTLNTIGYGTQSFDALEMDQYTKLHLMLQTLVEEAGHLQRSLEAAESSSKDAQKNIHKKKRLIKHVWENVTATRMQSLDTLVSRFPQVLKQLKRSYGKDVKLETRGTNLLLDKWVVEKLYDPLLHLVRNSFDHGIEQPQERQEIGKSTSGCIQISAYNQGQYTVIEVRDDGKGIDLEKVKSKALMTGLATSQQLQRMSSQEILQLVFQPGFSTSSELSNLSGRGIGLDVVRSQLDLLNGHITINSTPNQGTTFSLKLPLSLTIIRLLLCRVNDNIYALPEDSVERIIFPSPEQIQVTSDHRRILHWKTSSQETKLRLLSLSQLLHYSKTAQAILQIRGQKQESSISRRRSPSTSGDRYPVLVLNIEGHLTGVEVDAILSEEELVIRPLVSNITAAPFIHGCCFFGNNQLALVIDILTLIQDLKHSEKSLLENDRQSAVQPLTDSFRSEHRSIASSQQLALSETGSNSITISDNSDLNTKLYQIPLLLVIDDSPTIRQTLTAILHRANYSVTQATDGFDALSKLDQNPNIKAIVCDLEMPRVNGFQFLETIKKKAGLADIPVIVLTSRSSSKHRQLAMGLGASEYLTKPCQHDHLLTTIEKTLHMKSILRA